MKKLYIITALILFASVVTGQGKLNIKVPYVDNPPTIDGFEEEIWDVTPAVTIDSIYMSVEADLNMSTSP